MTSIVLKFEGTLPDDFCTTVTFHHVGMGVVYNGHRYQPVSLLSANIACAGSRVTISLSADADPIENVNDVSVILSPRRAIDGNSSLFRAGSDPDRRTIRVTNTVGVPAWQATVTGGNVVCNRSLRFTFA